jgi:outer membrane protein assembly factor BamB
MSEKYIFVVIVFLGYIGISTCQWTQFGSNAQRIGRTNAVGSPSGTRYWTQTVGSGIKQSAIVGPDGTVYMGLSTGALGAIDGGTGIIKWSTTIGGSSSLAPALGPDGTLYNGHGRYLVAFNSANGVMKWNYTVPTTSGNIPSAPAVSGTMVAFGCSDNKIYALNSNTGALLWTYATGSGIQGTPAIGLNGNVLQIANDGYLYSINPSGTLYWKVAAYGSVNTFIIGSVAVDTNGTIYCSDYSGVRAVSQAGTQLWVVSIACISSPAIGWNGYVYIGSLGTNTFYCFNSKDGSTVWSYNIGNAIWSTASVGSDGSVYVGANTGYIYCLNGATGAVKWSFNTNGIYVMSSPAIGPDGSVYASDFEGVMHAFLGTYFILCIFN